MTDGNDAIAILVVDDFEDHREVLVEHLWLLGYKNTLEAENGEDALRQLAEHKVDLVLLDVVMPKLDGYGVLERMKSDEGLRHIPVIMVSALAEFETAVRCIEKGAEDRLPKPFDPAVLKARISASLEKKRWRDRELAYLEAIDRERQRADELLRAILPSPAVEELRTHDRVAPRQFEAVTVLFADLVGFTAYCEVHEPNDVVTKLDRLAERSETLIERHGLEKIKTVGDGMMATANLLQPADDPVMRALRCAFDLLDAAQAASPDWQLRVGLHVGPVVAGVIGRSKFTYDLWGDTVNVAARLAGLGPRAAVNLSGSAWEQVRDRCDGERLDDVKIKGKVGLEIYRCHGLR